MTLARRAVSEAVGTALLAAVVGFGSMGERLAGASVAICANRPATNLKG